jgi:molybdopterin-guanine dinucleotide biosynthesis protein A
VEERRLKNLSILDYLSDVRYVSVEDLRRLDPDLLTFLNINTIADYEYALKVAQTFNREW